MAEEGISTFEDMTIATSKTEKQRKKKKTEKKKNRREYPIIMERMLQKM